MLSLLWADGIAKRFELLLPADSVNPPVRVPHHPFDEMNVGPSTVLSLRGRRGSGASGSFPGTYRVEVNVNCAVRKMIVTRGKAG